MKNARLSVNAASRRDCLRSMLADLKMPGSLDALD